MLFHENHSFCLRSMFLTLMGVLENFLNLNHEALKKKKYKTQKASKIAWNIPSLRAYDSIQYHDVLCCFFFKQYWEWFPYPRKMGKKKKKSGKKWLSFFTSPVKLTHLGSAAQARESSPGAEGTRATSSTAADHPRSHWLWQCCRGHFFTRASSSQPILWANFSKLRTKRLFFNVKQA